MNPIRLQNRIKAAVALIEENGMVDGAHHKQWVLDQVLRTLLGRDYQRWRVDYNALDGGQYEDWEEGIAP